MNLGTLGRWPNVQQNASLCGFPGDCVAVCSKSWPGYGLMGGDHPSYCCGTPIRAMISPSRQGVMSWAVFQHSPSTRKRSRPPCIKRNGGAKYSRKPSPLTAWPRRSALASRGQCSAACDHVVGVSGVSPRMLGVLDFDLGNWPSTRPVTEHPREDPRQAMSPASLGFALLREQGSSPSFIEV
jgi:hypothetical protein